MNDCYADKPTVPYETLCDITLLVSAISCGAAMTVDV